MNGDGLPSAIFEQPLLAGREWKLRKRRRGRHTELFEYANGGGGRIFVKRFPPAGSGVDRRLLREYRALRLLQGRLAPDLCRSIPAPMGAMHTHHALVVSGLDGMPLSRLLKLRGNRLWGRLHRRHLRSTGRSVGLWLRQFHGRTAGPSAPHDHEAFCVVLARELERLRQRAGDRGLDELSARVIAASARLDGVPLEMAGRHGDFLPQNILIENGRVSVVDFESYRTRDVVYRDVGFLLAYVSLLEHRFAYLPSALAAFSGAFLKAYGSAASVAAQNLFTAEAAIRIARDSGRPGIERLLGTVERLTQ